MNCWFVEAYAKCGHNISNPYFTGSVSLELCEQDLTFLGTDLYISLFAYVFCTVVYRCVLVACAYGYSMLVCWYECVYCDNVLMEYVLKCHDGVCL